MKAQIKGILIIITCTFLTSSAQLFLKKGANILYDIPIWTNWPVFLGILFYMMGAALLILGLRKGDVTSLYPLLATSYIWVTIFSLFLFGEQISAWKIVGIAFIVFGISLISLASKPKESIHYAEAT